MMGRPKGSRNKPKTAPPTLSEAAATQSASGADTPETVVVDAGFNRSPRQAFPDEADAFAANSGLMEDDATHDTPTMEERPTARAPAPETPDAGQEEEEGADDGFTPDLMARARDQGFTEQEARAFGDPDGLDRSLRALDRRMVAMHKQSRSQVPQSAPAAPMSPELAAALQQPQAPAQPAAATAAKLPYEVVLDADVVDESVIKAVKGMNEHYAKENAMLQQAVAGLIGQSQRPPPIDMSQRNNELDQFVNSLGEEWQEVFGQGTVEQIDPYSDHFGRRNKLGVARNEIEDMLRGRNGTTPSATQVLSRALHMSFGDEFEGMARKKVNNRVNKRREGASHPPTRRASSATDRPLTSREKAADHFKEKGIPDASAGVTKEEELYG